MDFLFAPTLWAAILTAFFSALFVLIGIIFRSIQESIDENDSHVESVDERLSDMELRVKTLFSWAFGNESNSTDKGFAGDIQAKLSELNETLEQFNEKENERHEEVVERLDELIIRLDNEDALEFERDDLE